MALTTYYPEMNQAKPAADFEARMSHRGEKGGYTIKTPKHIRGIGVHLVRVLQASDLAPQAQHKAGWNEYHLTAYAFRELCRTNSVAMEALL